MRMLMLSAAVFLIGMGELIAQQYCSSRSSIIDSLKSLHNEVLVAIGVIPGRGVMEILASEDGSFTVIFTNRTGTCIQASGEGFRFAPIEEAGEDS